MFCYFVAVIIQKERSILSENPPPRDHYDYSALVSDAFKKLVRIVLTRTMQEGLLGEHYFYITFETTHPQVEMPKSLKLAYPAEMTIVLQHEFFDLKVEEEHFSITLLFNKQPSHLLVPYDSMRVFFDPSVDVKLFFKTTEDGIDLNANAGSSGGIPLEEELVELKLEDASYETTVIGLGVQQSASSVNYQSSESTESTESTTDSGTGTMTDPVEVIMLDKFRKTKHDTPHKKDE